MAPTTGVKLASPKPLVVPILRAGLGMLDGMMRLLPTAEVGFLGMMRNEETLEASTYAERLPDDLSGRQCYVLDPMLATGGTLAAAIKFLTDRGADDITAICLLAAPEGCARLERELEGLDVPVTVVTAAMDEKLNEKGYIVPGLGDAGDRLYGLADCARGGCAVTVDRDGPSARNYALAQEAPVPVAIHWSTCAAASELRRACPCTISELTVENFSEQRSRNGAIRSRRLGSGASSPSGLV